MFNPHQHRFKFSVLKWVDRLFLGSAALFWCFCMFMFALGLTHQIDMLPRHETTAGGLALFAVWLAFPFYLSLLLAAILATYYRYSLKERVTFCLLTSHALAYWVFPPLLSWTVIYVGAPVFLFGLVGLLLRVQR